MKKVFVIFAFSLAMLSVTALATSTFKSTFNALYGTSGTLLDQCWTCHVEGQSYSNFNDYGSDLEDAYNQTNNRTEAHQLIETVDSDRDGDTNIIEIAAGTLPGDSSNSTPTEKTTWGAIKSLYK